jgi:microcystin-dependent protein
VLAIVALELLPRMAGAQVPQTTIQPVTSINYLVNSQGTFGNLGIIDMFAGNFTPGGEYEADGTTVSNSQNTELFN